MDDGAHVSMCVCLCAFARVSVCACGSYIVDDGSRVFSDRRFDLTEN